MFRRTLLAVSLVALALTIIPSRTVLANGAASTRNIIIGVGAATYLIIHHNRVVHQREAAQAAQAAAAQQQANNSNAAYHSEKLAYEHQLAVNRDLQNEIAYQHSVITQQNKQLAAVGLHTTVITTREVVAARPGAKAHPTSREIANVSYGWGTL